MVALTLLRCLSGETESLQDMLEQLSEPERRAQIQNWDCGGAVYLDYLHISNRLQELAQASRLPPSLPPWSTSRKHTYTSQKA